MWSNSHCVLVQTHGMTVLNNNIITTLQWILLMGFWPITPFKCLHVSPTGHTLVESTLFPRRFNEIMLNQRGIDIELMSVPSGLWYSKTFAYHVSHKLSIQDYCWNHFILTVGLETNVFSKCWWLSTQHCQRSLSPVQTEMTCQDSGFCQSWHKFCSNIPVEVPA
jgi:hypothetical protein